MYLGVKYYDYMFDMKLFYDDKINSLTYEDIKSNTCIETISV